MEGNLGILVRVWKGKYSGGQSSITYKQLKRTYYEATFYKEDEQSKGYIGSDKPFTFTHTEFTKANIRKYLKENGYTEFTIEEMWKC